MGEQIGEQKKNKKGRTTKYHPSMAERAYKLALLGLKNKDLAVAFGVDRSTIDSWLVKYKAFKEAVVNGREQADAEVAKALYHRAKGYSHPEEKVFVYQGKPTKVETTKYYPPDTMAAIFWLQNRQKEYWKDIRHYRHAGEEGGPIKHQHAIVDIDLSDMSNDELEMLESIGLKIQEKQEAEEQEEQ